MNTEDKNTFDALMKQAEFLAKRQSNRQSYQWKISFGLWAALGLALNSTIKLGHPGTLIIAWVVGGVPIVVLQCWWLGAVYGRNREDGERALWFRDKAEEYLRATDSMFSRDPDDSKKPRKPKESKEPWDGSWDGSFIRHYAHGVELSITVLIILLGILASTGRWLGKL